jgi:hypothetical protein
MEGDGKAKQRKLTRCYQCSRLEEEIWTTAFEQIWPVIRRALAQHRDDEPRFAGRQTESTTIVARRA